VLALGDLPTDTAVPSPTGVDEIDRVLGGGLVPGGVTLLGGEPGVGKSTLTLQLAVAVAGQGAGALVVAGEEAPTQIAARAGRLGPIPASLLVIDETSVGPVVEAIEEVGPQVAIVDSVQTLRHHEVDGAPGSVGQLKAVAEELVAVAKRTGVSVVLIGHVTKDGSLAGPKAIEHLVDTVLSFGGDPSGQLRFLRAVKHRYGPTTEVGMFEMGPGGLVEVADPSQRFLNDRRPGLPGSVVVPALDGRRPVMVEVQSLTVDSASGGGSVTVQGVETRRVALISAVLARRAGVSLARHNVFVSATGGARITEPGADLALALSLASSLTDRPIAPDVVACGEIGLGGELRSVPQMELRLQEAYRLGFRTAIVPASAPDGPTGLELVRTPSLRRALAASTMQPWNTGPMAP
jgi:DNA repair protein RadA/Sms